MWGVFVSTASRIGLELRIVWCWQRCGSCRLETASREELIVSDFHGA
jgi:hypothetical protein